MISLATVDTIAGRFDQGRLDRLKATIENEDREAVVQFEGNDLLVSFGHYLVEFVEGELAKKNGGL